MTTELNENNYCRLARVILERFGGTYQEALERLNQFQLNLVCGEEIRHSAALQTALLTAVNSGKRAFLGGVSVAMPEKVETLVPWLGQICLNEIVTSLVTPLPRPNYSREGSFTLCFGKVTPPSADALTVICSGWRGGIAPADQWFQLDDQHDFAMGGVMAGALGIARGFLQVCGLESHVVDRPVGTSLWRPDLNWLDKDAGGPRLCYLPKKIWFLGLGHLGQAFLWNIGLLPYENPADSLFLLQDYDRVIEGNWSAGLLCEKAAPGRYKTRLCADWLEARGFATRISERRYDSTLRRSDDEPFLALCGFDSGPARRPLEQTGFSFIVECGLGGNVDSFDDLHLHTFPGASRTPEQVWPETEQVTAPRASLREAFSAKDTCGVFADNLANKALSSCFVGAYCGALVTSEVLRGLHGGIRCEAVNGHLRNNSILRTAIMDETSQVRLAQAGYTPAQHQS